MRACGKPTEKILVLDLDTIQIKLLCPHVTGGPSSGQSPRRRSANGGLNRRGQQPPKENSHDLHDKALLDAQRHVRHQSLARRSLPLPSPGKNRVRHLRPPHRLRRKIQHAHTARHPRPPLHTPQMPNRKENHPMNEPDDQPNCPNCGKPLEARPFVRKQRTIYRCPTTGYHYTSDQLASTNPITVEMLESAAERTKPRND